MSKPSNLKQQTTLQQQREQEKDDREVERFLRMESTAFSQDKEVERILALKDSQDPFVILGMPESMYVSLAFDAREIKLQYRKRSLLVHPDKCKHPLAQEAFELLKKTEIDCLDPKKHALVMRYIDEARQEVFYKHKITIPKQDDRPSMFSDAPLAKLDVPRLMLEIPTLGKEIQIQFYKNLVLQGHRDRVRLRNEHQWDIVQEEKVGKVTKRKSDFDKQWDKSRDARIDSWKSFTGKKAKKKTKEKVLGAIPK